MPEGDMTKFHPSTGMLTAAFGLGQHTHLGVKYSSYRPLTGHHLYNTALWHGHHLFSHTERLCLYAKNQLKYRIGQNQNVNNAMCAEGDITKNITLLPGRYEKCVLLDY